MRKYFYFLLLIAVVAFNGCKKEMIKAPFDAVLSQPYTTGIIKFQYKTPGKVLKVDVIKDTTVSFTSMGNNPSEWDLYGYSQPSTPWVQLHRLNPNDFQNRAFIFFVGTDLNSLTLPYRFTLSNTQNAQINYVLGVKRNYDSNGNPYYTYNGYSASTMSDKFTLTILSRVNNRLQGTFSGIITDQSGHSINIEKGLFDIKIVEK